MAVDQDLLDQIAATVADLYRDVESALIKAVAQRLRADPALPSPFEEGKLDAVRKLQASARLILASLQATRSKVIRDAIAAAYRSGGDAALADLPAEWFPKSGIGEQARDALREIPNARVIENIAAALHRDVGRVDMNILRAPLDAYRAVQAGAAARITSGAFTRREASQAAWQRLMDKGIVDFTDRAGRRWKLSSYVEMLARTNAQRAAVQGQTDRLQELGIDLVYISDNVQECKRCRPFESKVLARGNGPVGKVQVEHATRDGEMVTVDVIDTLQGAMAKGLFHPNCRHSASAYLPGVTTLKKNTADPKGDRARQKQRALERKIRAEKEKALGALTPEAKKEANAKVRAAQAALRAHLAANPKLKRLPYREQIGAGDIPRGEPKGGPVTDLAPPVQETLPLGSPEAGTPARPTPTKPAAPSPAEAEQAAAKQAAEQAKARAQAEAEAARKAKAEAEAAALAKAKADQEAKEAAEKAAAIAKAKKEAAEAARKKAAEEALRTSGMRDAVRHRTEQAGLDWARTRLPLPHDLTEDEKQSISEYTGAAFSAVNKFLRQGIDAVASHAKQIARDIVAGLRKAFTKSRLPESVIVHRGVGAPFAGFIGADVTDPASMQALVGKVFVDKGYVSTSVGPTAAFEGDVYLMIKAPKGAKAINVMPLSDYGEEEREVLLDAGTTFVVHAAYQRNDHRGRLSWFMELEAVEDGWTPPPGWRPNPSGDADEGYKDKM